MYGVLVMKNVLVLGVFAMTALFTSAVMAQPETPNATAGTTHVVSADSGSSWFFPSGSYGANFGAALGAGIVVMGAARGIGNIGSSAVESMARQPEAGGAISGAMLLSCALIEGVALFGVVVTLLVALK